MDSSNRGEGFFEKEKKDPPTPPKYGSFITIIIMLSSYLWTFYFSCLGLDVQIIKEIYPLFGVVIVIEPLGDHQECNESY
jgi:hypothetical protein